MIVSETFSVLVPIPGERGVVVIGLLDLLGAAADGDINVDDLAIDSTFSDTEAVEMIGRVRRLNQTGDVDGFHAGLKS